MIINGLWSLVLFNMGLNTWFVQKLVLNHKRTHFELSFAIKMAHDLLDFWPDIELSFFRIRSGLDLYKCSDISQNSGTFAKNS